MSEVSTEQQLELALMLLSKEQREEIFTRDLKILQLECSLMDARREVHNLKHTEARLKMKLKEVFQHLWMAIQ